ncbi:hypothetical protein [Enterococcus faecalis]|uniref:hypothetical protein n=1 Tax=Enterococcus faecalis TaxID=1351 RepID=UPI0002EAC8B2|nr:hypothetical protein [Enterococcus faecalis]
MNKLNIQEIKTRIEQTFPELILGWDMETNKPNIYSKTLCRVVAYTYHKKWILKAEISEYSNHIAAIINLLEQWDGKSGVKR